MLVIFITKRTILYFITLCSTYDTKTFGPVKLNGIPAVFYPKMAFSKQHGLRSGYACFSVMISFDNKWSFCYVFFTYFCFLQQQYAVSVCFLYLLLSCAHIRMYYHIKFIHVADIFRTFIKADIFYISSFFRIVMHYFTKFVVGTSRWIEITD